jgi:hypothetical protein
MPLADCVTITLPLFMQAGAWRGVASAAALASGRLKTTLAESFENNFMSCCRGLHLPYSQHKHPCYLSPSDMIQLEYRI